MEMYVFYYRNMNIGGCQLLILNFAKELMRQGNQVVVICEFIDDVMRKSTGDVIIRDFGYKDWKSDTIIHKALISMPNANIVSFLWEDFSRVYALKAKNQRALFYAVHADAVKFAAYSENRFLRIFRKWCLTSTIKKLIHNNAIVVMDEQTIRHSEEYYGLNFSTANIVHIPVEYSEDDYNIDNIIEKVNENKKIILAVARADFPFKGYLLGLIKALHENLIPPNYNLVIVSYGKDEEILKSAINGLEETKRTRVTLLGETPYSELKKLFIKATLYVGMGTTLLDATKYGVISIPAVPYTNRLLCNHFFYEKPSCLGIESGNEDKFRELIQQYENMSIQERKIIIQNSVEIVKTIHSLKNCVDELRKAFLKLNNYQDRKIEYSYRLRKIKRLIQEKTRGKL